MLKAQDGTDHQKQFQAAVDVIQRLPKDGPYRPSYEVMLRFYSYYKQATMGRCNTSRPGFWDPIGRYKWDAWNGLGDLTRGEAMAAYIREMKKVAQKIIDTVPMEEASSDMFQFFEPLYQMIPDMPRPPDHVFKKINGSWDQSSEFSLNDETNENHLTDSVSAESKQVMDRLAPLGEEQHHLKEESHQDNPDENTYIVKQLMEEEKEVEGYVTVPLSGLLALEEKIKIGDPRPTGDTVDRRQVTSDSETEVFCDSLDQLELNQDSAVLDSDCQSSAEGLHPTLDNEYKNSAVKRVPSVGSQVVRKGESAELGSTTAHKVQTSRDRPIARDSGVKLHTEMNIHVNATMRRLQEDIQALQLRLSHLEAKVTEKNWWQSLEASRPTLLFLVVWPLLVQWLFHRYQNRKK